MVKRVIFSVIVIVLLIGTSILTACSPTPAPAPSSAPAASPASASSPSPAAQGPIRGGILRTATFSDPATTNPLASTSGYTLTHASQVFNSIVRTDPQKKDVNLANIIPDLAEKWDISPDGKTYTFYLRQGVKFHDGVPFTAKDVKYSLDMFRDPKSSPSANNVGAIDNVEIVNDLTVKVNLKYPYADLLVYLLPPYFEIIPEHLKAVDPKSTAFLVGTGPFKFKSSVPGKVYTYERNPDYFVKGLPYLDGVEIYVLDVNTIANQFVGGRLDTSGTLRQYLEDITVLSIVKKGAPEAPIIRSESGMNRLVQFNLSRKGAWQDPKVRQAMSLVIDYPGSVVASAGTAEVGHVTPVGMIPSYMKEAMTQKDLMAAMGIDKSMDDRVAKAKQLMKDAGYANGFSTEILTQDTPTTNNLAVYLADVWKRNLNIDVKVNIVPPVQAYPRASSGDFDLYENTITGTGDSPIEYYGNFITGAPINSGKWSNKEYDDLFQQFVRETDPAKRISESLKLQQILLTDMPVIMCHFAALTTAARPDMRVGWPAVNGPVPQPASTTLSEVDRIWFAGTPDAARWTKSQ
jgi:peptide/nickel transport system substrate-binding protein